MPEQLENDIGYKVRIVYDIDVNNQEGKHVSY